MENLQGRAEVGELVAFSTADFQAALIGLMGHDLRQPLQIIRGTYELLRSGLDEMPQRGWLDRGEKALERLTEQLNCVVQAFYLAEQSNVLEIAPVPLRPLFLRLQHENETTAQKGGIVLRTRAADVAVLSNPLLLECVLRNLLTNAVKCTEPGGRILVSCRRKQAELRIDVCDTGIGIPEDQLPLIFDAFSHRFSRRGDGLGIGLSIVRRALSVLGHRIEVKSVVGKGSRFSVYVPTVAVPSIY
jgi:two-component system phosphate regulon sensor histidine kinase PhoR